jgi:hypothetical protein
MAISFRSEKHGAVAELQAETFKGGPTEADSSTVDLRDQHP